MWKYYIKIITHHLEQHVDRGVRDGQGGAGGWLQRLPVPGADAEPDLRPAGARHLDTAEHVAHQDLERHADVLHVHGVHNAEAVLEPRKKIIV